MLLKIVLSQILVCALLAGLVVETRATLGFLLLCLPLVPLVYLLDDLKRNPIERKR